MNMTFFKSNGWFYIVLYMTFVALGLPDTGFGVAWNEISQTMNQPIAYGGIVSSIVIACGACSGFMMQRLLRVMSTLQLCILSIVFTGIASFGYAFAPSFFIMLLWSIPLGLGAGAVDTALNQYAAHHLTSLQMNWLHSFWGVGATLSPLLVTYGMTTWGSWRASYLLIGGIILGIALLLYRNKGLWNAQSRIVESEQNSGSIPVRTQFTMALSIMSYMLYVALEASFGLWLSVILIETQGVSIAIAGSLSALYFGMIMMGRFLCGFIAQKIGNRKLVRLGILIASLGSILFLSSQLWVCAIGIFALGFGFAPIYPSLMHETSKRYPHAQANHVIAQQVAFAYISLLLVVPFLGFVASAIGMHVIAFFEVGGIILLGIVVHALDQRTA